MTPSPFVVPLGTEIALPQVFRDQFLGDGALLQGVMTRVWHRPRWIRPLLRLLACANVLVPDTGNDVPAHLRIEPVPGGQAWRRTFGFTRVRRFDALLVHDGKALLERTGPFEVEWDVRFRDPDTIFISTLRARVRLGRVRVGLPSMLVPDVRAIELALGPDKIWVSLVASHRLLGEFFGYSGTFRLRRV